MSDLPKLLPKVKILTLGELTKTGRIYPKEEFTKSLDSWFNNTAKPGGCVDIISLDYRNGIPAENISHIVKLITIEDNGVYADIEILPTPAGKILSELLKDPETQCGVRFSPVGMGKLNEDTHEISDYQLISVGYHFDPVQPKEKLEENKHEEK